MAAEAIPEDLREWGYAPGEYVARCITCPGGRAPHAGATAHQSAWRCKDHAVAAWKRSNMDQFDG